MRAHSLREPEVQDLDDTRIGHLDVGRLQVAVDDAELVRRFEALGDLPGEREPLGERQAARVLVERSARHELHDERPNRRGVLDAMHVRDVRVIEGGDRAGFAFEAVAEFAGRLLDRDEPVQSRVARLVDLSHPAFPQFFENAIWTKAVTGIHHVTWLGIPQPNSARRIPCRSPVPAVALVES